MSAKFKSIGIASAISLLIADLIGVLFFVYEEELLALIWLFLGFLSWSYTQIRLRGGNVVQADVFFGFFLYLYSFAAPISALLSGQSISSSDYFYDAVVACLVANIGLHFGFLIYAVLSDWQLQPRASFSLISFDELMAIRRAGYFLVIFGFLSSAAAIILTVGVDAYFSAGYAGRALLKRDAGPIELGLYVSIIGLALSFCVAVSTSGSSKDRSVIYLAILAFVIYISFLGIRRPTFLLLMSVFCIYSVVTNKVKLRYAVIISLLGLILLGTFANYRQVLAAEGVGSAANFVADNYSDEWWDFSRTELGAPFDTLVTAFQGWTSEPLLLGRSYLDSFVYVLPGSINGGVQSLSVQYTNKYFSLDFIGIGGNMGFFPVTEALLNFGMVGVFVVFVFFGIAAFRLNKYLYSTGRSAPYLVVACSLALPWFAFFMRLDFASFAKGFLYSQAVAMVAATVYVKVTLGRRGKSSKS